MAAIPYWAWLISGFFIAGVSITVGEQLTLFAWAGVLFIIIGISKLVVFFVLSPKETKYEQKIQTHYQPTYGHHAPNLYCPRCRMTISRHDNYCRLCGQKLR